MKSPIRILIVDDHRVVRMGLQAMMASKPGLKVVGEASDGIEAIQKAQTLLPDVILMDLVMPTLDGIKAIQKIKQVIPEIQILVLTSFTDQDKIFSALEGGASGYVLKDTTPGELLMAIEAVLRHEAFLSPSIASRIIKKFNKSKEKPSHTEPITSREEEVLALVARGYSNQEIADLLFISPRTVGAHVSSILEKLHLENRTQAALYAIENDLVR